MVTMPSFSEHLIMDGFGYAYGIAVADIDGDGHPDITVADADASAAACVELGGELVDGPRDMGGYRFCVIRDPAGAVAGLISKPT